MNKVWWIFGVLMVLCMSCGDDNSCVTGAVEFKNLEDLGCRNTTNLMTVASDQEFELIRSQEDFDALVDVNCTPDIDWQFYDLIAGMRGFSRGIATIEKNLVQDCMTNQKTLRITFTLNETAVAPFISFHALIPKLGDLERIFVDFIVIE